MSMKIHRMPIGFFTNPAAIQATLSAAVARGAAYTIGLMLFIIEINEILFQVQMGYSSAELHICHN